MRTGISYVESFFRQSRCGGSIGYTATGCEPFFPERDAAQSRRLQKSAAAP
jgi:hypothetical protein